MKTRRKRKKMRKRMRKKMRKRTKRRMIRKMIKRKMLLLRREYATNETFNDSVVLVLFIRQ